MLLAFFFNRFSLMVKVMEVASWILIPLGIAMCIHLHSGAAVLILVAANVLTYAFLKFCAVYHWHKEVPRYSGIELHFIKIRVAAAYVMAFLGLSLLIWPSIIWPIFTLLILVGAAHVNIILLYLFRKDDDTISINYFSRGEYLSE